MCSYEATIPAREEATNHPRDEENLRVIIVAYSDDDASFGDAPSPTKRPFYTSGKKFHLYIKSSRVCARVATKIEGKLIISLS